jgi:undecaprenyl diphosphate synthase
LWPDFRGAQLLEGIEEYQKRDRRYGGLGPDGHAPQPTPLRAHAEAKR